MKFLKCFHVATKKESRPARGAWVEIALTCAEEAQFDVAPRKGRVG